LLFSAEQTLLIVRVGADSRARRGELSALRYSDLERRVLTIQRGVSRGVLDRPSRTGRAA
jgi:integrase